MVMRFFIALSCSFFLVILDQLSKWWVTQSLFNEGSNLSFLSWFSETPAQNAFNSVDLFPGLNFVMVWNSGISFGFLNQDSAHGALWLSLITGLIVLGFIVWLFREKNIFISTGLVMIIGGALGNIIDRLRFGAVIDFIDVHIHDYHWPAFNVADSLVFLGVCTLLIQALFFDHNPADKTIDEPNT